MPAVTIDVPPPPPMPTTPPISSREARYAREGLAHGGDRAAAIFGLDRRVGAAGMEGGHLPRRHARFNPRRACPDIDDQRVAARLAYTLGEIGKLLALCVGGADDIDALHCPGSPPRALPAAISNLRLLLF